MRELLQPGNLCYLMEMPGAHRKTRYDLALVSIERAPSVAVDTPRQHRYPRAPGVLRRE